MITYIFDACALIAFLNDEEGSDSIERILLQENHRFISIINVYEVCYDAAKRAGVDEGIKIFEEIKSMPIEIVYEISKRIIEKALHFKTKYRISLADSIALGLTKVKDAVLVTCDHHELDCIDDSKEIEFYWFR